MSNTMIAIFVCFIANACLFGHSYGDKYLIDYLENKKLNGSSLGPLIQNNFNEICKIILCERILSVEHRLEKENNK